MLTALLAAGAPAHAQGRAALAAKPQAPAEPWQRCRALADTTERLACFDHWAATQATDAAAPLQAMQAAHSPAATHAPSAANARAGAAPASTTASTAASSAAAEPAPGGVPTPVDATLPATRIIEVAQTEGCRDAQYTELARFWELESGTDCGTFNFRGYRPMSVSLIRASNVNRMPSSESSLNTASNSIDYRRTEARIQLSVRTKLAQSLLTPGGAARKDSLWFGYTQQSYWQVFSGDLSRPFRNTDHEPEVMYVYPTDVALPLGWRLRYSGVGLVHQSNGQSLPLSRSWNRAYLMAGMELDNRWRVQARIWKRFSENSASDDNPAISAHVGRGELQAFWNVDRNNTLGATWRSPSLSHPTRGSVRLEWLQALSPKIGGGPSNLRLHTQLFSGYGDSLIDYNRRRTVLSLGVSLVEF